MINATQINRHYYYPDKYKDQADEFFSIYSLQRELGCPSQKMTGLKKRNQRVCRFCNKKYPYVGFRKDAHIIPEMLGNRYLVSDFECDDCNHKFGKYESDFANFLGMVRTTSMVKGKENVPKFKSADKKVVAETIVDKKDGTLVNITRTDRFDTSFQYDKEKEQTVISVTKSPFTPLHLYKFLVKMALSIMPEEEMSHYKSALEYIRTDKHDGTVNGFGTSAVYIMPLSYQLQDPSTFLFKKKSSTQAVMTHVFAFSFLHYMYQIVLPFYTYDYPFYKTGKITSYWCPPIFSMNEEQKEGFVSQKTYDFNSRDRISGAMEQLVLPGKLGDISEIVGFQIMKMEDQSG